MELCFELPHSIFIQKSTQKPTKWSKYSIYVILTIRMKKNNLKQQDKSLDNNVLYPGLILKTTGKKW